MFEKRVNEPMLLLKFIHNLKKWMLHLRRKLFITNVTNARNMLKVKVKASHASSSTQWIPSAEDEGICLHYLGKDFQDESKTLKPCVKEVDMTTKTAATF